MKTSEQSKARKEASLAILADCFERATIAIFTDYSAPKAGLTVKEITDLRGKLREQNAEYRVAKNTLIGKVLRERGVEGAEGQLVGPSAVAFGYGDPACAAKTILEFSKDNKPNGLPIVKGAVMDNRVITHEELVAIASLPSLDVLRTQLLGLMLAPHRNVMGVLNAPGRSMATVLDAWTKKETEEVQA